MTKPARLIGAKKGSRKPSARSKPRHPVPKPELETILLVDDDGEMLAFLTRILSGAGYRVLTAGDGESALGLSEDYPKEIHLLITDVMMPLMNGKELADRMCSLRPEIKVLFVSGYNRADLWPGDVCEDQTDWLPKPFTATQFQLKVRQILDGIRKA